MGHIIEQVKAWGSGSDCRGDGEMLFRMSRPRFPSKMHNFVADYIVIGKYCEKTEALKHYYQIDLEVIGSSRTTTSGHLN